MIRAPFGDSEIVIQTTARLAGAIHSVKWNGKEFIDSGDHGRQLQSASSFDNTPQAGPETFNPTEAGSIADGAGPHSSSRLLELHAEGATLRDTDADGLLDGTRQTLEKEVRIGIPGLPNVLDYTVTFGVPAGEPHRAAQFEALTGYMPAEFERFWAFDAATGKLEPLSDGPGEQRQPVALSTRDGAHAMAIISPEPPPAGTSGPGYGRFRFPRERVTKWNCVFRVQNPGGAPPGRYRYRMFVPIGTLADVEAALVRLSSLPAAQQR